MKPKHQKIMELRHDGLTLKAISERVGLSKSTVSYVLNKHFPRDLHERTTKTNALASAKTRDNVAIFRGHARYYQDLRTQAKEKYLLLLENSQDKDLIFYMAGLYAGEGSKTSSFEICNANPAFISIVIRFLKEVIRLSEDRIVLSLYVHGTMCRETCVKQWSGYGLEVDRVHQLDNRPKKKPSDQWEGRYYGVVRLYVRSGMGLREALEEYANSLWK